MMIIAFVSNNHSGFGDIKRKFATAIAAVTGQA